MEQYIVQLRSILTYLRYDRKIDVDVTDPTAKEQAVIVVKGMMQNMDSIKRLAASSMFDMWTRMNMEADAADMFKTLIEQAMDVQIGNIRFVLKFLESQTLSARETALFEKLESVQNALDRVLLSPHFDEGMKMMSDAKKSFDELSNH